MFRPNNPAETLVYQALTLTWLFYGCGALYLLGPALGWILGAMTVLSIYLGAAIRQDLHATGPVPPVVWAWIIGMAVMLIALWISHLDWQLGLKQTIKSSVGWAKGWALLALFPLAGAVLPIRRGPLIRAQCIVGACTLCILPLLLIAPYIGLPEKIFTSPLKAVGGPGPEYFSVYLYTRDPSSWAARWQFFAPWSPFAGLLGVVMVLFALEEKHRGWLLAGVLAGVAMVLLSKSRMSLVALVVATVSPRMAPLLLRGWAWACLAAFSTSMAAVGAAILSFAEDAVHRFRSARADSTRVRETLQRIAEDRWANEAVWFGHGTVQPGPHLVEYMPIGSHHTWYGLLFVKGVIGFGALFVPLVWQTLVCLMDAALGSRGRLPLGLMIVLIILSFGENIEIEVYLLWPALLMLGIHARELQAS